MSSESNGGAGCGCLSKVDEAMASRNTRVMLPWLGPQRPFVVTTKVDEKKRGKPSSLFASYCPFCGVKYPDDDSNGLPAAREVKHV